MGYVNTPAFRTESLARHGGDDRWPAVPSLVIRHANVDAPSNLPGAHLGDFSFVAALPELLRTLTSVGTTVYGITEQRKDKKQAQRDQASAEAAAAKAAADTVALQAAVLKKEEAKQAPGITIAGTKVNPLLLVGGGVAAIGLLVLLLRRK